VRSFFVFISGYLFLAASNCFANDLLIFSASWCGPCQNLKRAIAAEPEMTAHLQTKNIDIDVDKELAKKYHVGSVPTLIILQDNGTIRRYVGFTSSAALKKWLINTD